MTVYVILCPYFGFTLLNPTLLSTIGAVFNKVSVKGIGVYGYGQNAKFWNGSKGSFSLMPHRVFLAWTNQMKRLKKVIIRG